jgi:hypothetical protein
MVVVVVVINLSNMPGKHEIKELHKTARLGTPHILREDLVYEYKPFNLGSNITYTINCSYRTAAGPCTLET